MTTTSESAGSTPSSPSSSTSSTLLGQTTNTIHITSVPREFFHPLLLHTLHQHFASYGAINRWIPLPGFARIIVVYYSESHAERAKLECDPLTLEATDGRPEMILRVYRADPTPTDDVDVYLHPPPIEKNFLISPPGSPPVGWEPVKEDPPNATPLADDLIAALRKLQVHNKRSSLEVLVEPDDASGVGVYVQDCDFDEKDDEDMEQDWIYGEISPMRAKWMPIATARPPIRTAL